MFGRGFKRYLAKRDRESRERDKEFRERDREFKEWGEESREFHREILLRNEKVYTSAIAEMERNSRRIDEGTKQLRANTQAVLSVLDRLNGSSS